MSIKIARVRDGEGDAALCPSCNNTVRNYNYRVDYDAGESFIYRCPLCDLLFLYPLMLSEISRRPMESVDDANMFNNSVLRKLHERFIIQREIKTVNSLLDRNNFSLLD